MGRHGNFFQNSEAQNIWQIWQEYHKSFHPHRLYTEFSQTENINTGEKA